MYIVQHPQAILIISTKSLSFHRPTLPPNLPQQTYTTPTTLTTTSPPYFSIYPPLATLAGEKPLK